MVLDAPECRIKCNSKAREQLPLLLLTAHFSNETHGEWQSKGKKLLLRSRASYKKELLTKYFKNKHPKMLLHGRQLKRCSHLKVKNELNKITTGVCGVGLNTRRIHQASVIRSGRSTPAPGWIARFLVQRLAHRLQRERELDKRRRRECLLLQHYFICSRNVVFIIIILDSPVGT